MPQEVQPVYLLVPSRGYGMPTPTELDPVIAGFIDALAVCPAAAEGMLIGVSEYSTFVNELFPLRAAWEDAVQVSVSGFDDLDFAASFDDLARLVAYDGYRLAGQGVRACRPLIVMILDTAPLPDDDWASGYRALCGTADEADHAAPIIVTVALNATAREFAKTIAHPAVWTSVAGNVDGAGALAASAVLDKLAGRR